MSDESVSRGQAAEEPQARAAGTGAEQTPPETADERALTEEPDPDPEDRELTEEELDPPVEPVMSAVTFNAVKHGIFSVSPVVPFFECEEDWEAFRDSIFEELKPRGGLQMALADRVAMLLWRLMRVTRFERESVTASLLEVRRDIERVARIYKDPLPPPGVVTAELKERMDQMAMHRLLPDEATLNKLMRYETRLHRHVLQTLHQLALLQGDRPRSGGRYFGVTDLDAPGIHPGSNPTPRYLLERGEEAGPPGE